MDPASVVREFHEAMQARDWERAASFLSSDIDVWWPVTNERFRGADFLGMERAYPEGWEITIEETMAGEGRAAARIRVDQDGEVYWCHGWYEVEGGGITRAVELWGTEASESPPEWRVPFGS